MNDRIKELAIQAGFFYEDYKDIWYLEYHNQTCEEEMKKFAELIVRECTNIGDNYQDILGNEPECFNCRKVAYGIVDKIKQHFGVES